MTHLCLSRRSFLLLAALLTFAAVPVSSPPAQSDTDVAGEVVKLQSAAVAMQDALPRPLKVGDKIFRGDVISTGKGARLEMKMIDDTVMTLGEKTVFVVIDYIAAGPAPNAAVRLMEGAFAVATGKLPKLANASMRIETEVATIGIRGTAFWGGPIDGSFGIALLSEGAIEVANKGGRVVIDKLGDGTAVSDANAAPAAPAAWRPEKVERAKKTVAFD